MTAHSASSGVPRRTRQARRHRRPIRSHARDRYHGGKVEHRNKHARVWCVVWRGVGEFRHKCKPEKKVARGAVTKKNAAAGAAVGGGESETAGSFWSGQAGRQHPPTCAYIAGLSKRRPLVSSTFHVAFRNDVACVEQRNAAAQTVEKPHPSARKRYVGSKIRLVGSMGLARLAMGN